MIAVLNTEPGITKAQLKEWLEKSDTPDNAELSIDYREGNFVLWWRWSYSAGAFGDDMVIFDKVDSDELKKEIRREEEGQ